MRTSEPTLEEVLLEVLDSRLADLHTCLPGRVESYDDSKQTANVQLQIKSIGFDVDGNPVASSFPVLPNIPVAWPRAGEWFLTMPLAKGDFVMVMFSESAIDQWRSKGRETHPGDLRRHGLTGAVALPCLYPQPATLTEASGTDLILGKQGGSKVRIKPGGEVEIGESSFDFVALAQKVENLADLFNTAIGAGFTAVGVGTAANGPAGKTAFDSAMAARLPVASSKVKAE